MSNWAQDRPKAARVEDRILASITLGAWYTPERIRQKAGLPVGCDVKAALRRLRQSPRHMLVAKRRHRGRYAYSVTSAQARPQLDLFR